MKYEEMPRSRAPNPFDDRAESRLRRMGLLDENSQPDKDAVAVLADVFAGQYFDDLCDYYQDMRAVREALRLFAAETERASPRKRFVLLCLQYDAIYRELPDPVWWISGNIELADRFSSGFVSRLGQLAEEGE